MTDLNIAEEFDQCIKCGLCMATCPVYKELLLEKYSPRGKVQLARYFKAGTFRLTDHTRDVFAGCLLCGACSTTCPSGVDLQKIFLAMRTSIAGEIGLTPQMRAMVESLTDRRNIAGEDNSERGEWLDDLPDESAGISPGAGADIAYFVGCVASFFPMAQGIARNMVRIIQAAGASFSVLGGQEWCCGFPAIAAGEPERSEELKAHNVERIRELGVSTVVFSCPSCLKTWKEHYGLDLDLVHSTQLIARFIDQGKLTLGRLDGTVTYHDPCDLGRQGGEYSAPRKILKSIPGLTFVELNGNMAQSICCGGGGNVESADPELSRLVAKKKLAQIRDSGADTLATSCQQCVRTIKGEARRSGDPVHVTDITDLVIESLSNRKE